MKTYYTFKQYVKTPNPRYLDEQGKEQPITGSVLEWENQHKSAVYLKPQEFDRRVLSATQERQKLNAWREWAV